MSKGQLVPFVALSATKYSGQVNILKQLKNKGQRQKPPTTKYSRQVNILKQLKDKRQRPPAAEYSRQVNLVKLSKGPRENTKTSCKGIEEASEQSKKFYRSQLRRRYLTVVVAVASFLLWCFAGPHLITELGI